MFKTINIYEFRSEFKSMGRGDEFSFDGLTILFDYLTDYEFCGEPYELDVIALCCDFDEATPREIAESYSIDIDGLNDAEVMKAVIDYLSDESVLVGSTDTTIVYQQF